MRRQTRWFPHLPEPKSYLLALLVAVTLSACSDDGDSAAAPDASTPAPPDSISGGQDATTAGTTIRIELGGAQLAGRLDDTPTARDLAAQLPLTLTFRDHNGVEKTAPLPRELSREGAPDGHDPVAGDIGYWAPGGDLVFYYDTDAPFFDGIIKVGELESGTQAVENQKDDFTARIERAR